MSFLARLFCERSRGEVLAQPRIGAKEKRGEARLPIERGREREGDRRELRF